MTHTTYGEFVELARRGTFVPVYKEILADLLTPVSAFLKIAEHSDYAFLLDSVEGGERVARYSFLGKDPFLVLRARAGRTIEEGGGERREVDEPFVAAHSATHTSPPEQSQGSQSTLLHSTEGSQPTLSHSTLEDTGKTEGDL